MEDKKLTPREMCVFALSSMGEGATVGDIMEAVDKYVLSLGVQSPNPMKYAFADDVEQFYEDSPAPDEKDENGLMLCAHCGGKAEISERPVGMAGMHMGEVWRVYCPSCGIATQENSNHLEEAMKAWNTRAHAPSAGKDQEIERWRNACHEHESKKLAMKSKADKRISELKEKTSKLIEALEEIVNYKMGRGEEYGDSYSQLKEIADKALAAYKGKEAKEGGEG